MFAHRHFAARYFSPRYWPPVAASDSDVEILGGGYYGSPYKKRDKRDYAQEIIDSQEQISRAEEYLARKQELAEIARSEGLRRKEISRLQKESKQLQNEILSMQIHLQALVAMKKRKELDDEESILALMLSSPFV